MNGLSSNSYMHHLVLITEYLMLDVELQTLVSITLLRCDAATSRWPWPLWPMVHMANGLWAIGHGPGL